MNSTRKEWPKRMWASGLDFDVGEEPELVIPADLGRGMYEEALALMRDYLESEAKHPDMEGYFSRHAESYPALARYEREVGSTATP